MNKLNPSPLPGESMTQQMSEQNIKLINKNKAAAAEILTRLSNSLQMETASHVSKISYVTRTEQL